MLSLLYVTHVSSRCRCRFFVTIRLHFRPPRAPCHIPLRARAHVSSSDSESAFEDLIPIHDDDDKDDDAECIFWDGLFAQDNVGRVDPVHTVQKVG